jgi:hypothetical protein
VSRNQEKEKKSLGLPKKSLGLPKTKILAKKSLGVPINNW